MIFIYLWLVSKPPNCLKFYMWLFTKVARDIFQYFGRNSIFCYKTWYELIIDPGEYGVEKVKEFILPVFEHSIGRYQATSCLAMERIRVIKYIICL